MTPEKQTQTELFLADFASTKHGSANHSLPAQSTVLLPALEVLSEMGGRAPTGEIVNAVSDRLGITAAARKSTHEVDCGRWGKRLRNPWRMTLNRVKYFATLAGLLERSRAGFWTLSAKGRGSLLKCKPGVIVTIYSTPAGEVVWADAMTAAGAVRDNSVDLLFSSPPYPLAGKGRKYGNMTPGETVELIVNCAKEWKRALVDTGSIVLNFRDTWLPKSETGGAVRSLYQEKILLALVEDVKLFFADRMFFRNPVCTGDAWVTVRHVRTTLNCENLLWLSKSPNPKADNRRVLVPPKASTIATYLRKARRGQKKVVGPSGQGNIFEEQMAAVAAGQEIKVIPRSILDFANSDPKKALHAKLDELGLPHHDATMAPKLAEFFIKFLTTAGDLVWDPFFGSGTTGLEAEKLGRRFLGSDYSLAHILGSAVRWSPDALRYDMALP
jgi:site-specific DNA-methyltransferase (cytosine-N4-specific)